MTRYQPERQTVRRRTATVTAVNGARVTLSIDGTTVPNVPVYGPVPPVNSGVLALDQGGSLVVLGDAVSIIRELTERIERLEARHAES